MAFDAASHRRLGGGQNGQLSPRDSTTSVLNLLHDLNEHPMSALDVNFEVLHSKVIFMPGKCWKFIDRVESRARWY